MGFTTRNILMTIIGRGVFKIYKNTKHIFYNFTNDLCKCGLSCISIKDQSYCIKCDSDKLRSMVE